MFDITGHIKTGHKPVNTIYYPEDSNSLKVEYNFKNVKFSLLAMTFLKTFFGFSTMENVEFKLARTVSTEPTYDIDKFQRDSFSLFSLFTALNTLNILYLLTNIKV
jgi:hypothetical protein